MEIRRRAGKLVVIAILAAGVAGLAAALVQARVALVQARVALVRARLAPRPQTTLDVQPFPAPRTRRRRPTSAFRRSRHGRSSRCG